MVRAFEAETVTNNREVARILSAVPELEGELNLSTGIFRSQRLPIPDDCVQFPPRTELPLVVLVINPT